MVDDLGGQVTGFDRVGPIRAIPQTGIVRQLPGVYNDLNNPDLAAARARNPNVDPASRPALRNFGPEQFGYPPQQVAPVWRRRFAPISPTQTISRP
jgi:hypothetical protein